MQRVNSIWRLNKKIIRLDINIQSDTISLRTKDGIEVSNGKDTVKVVGKINPIIIKDNTALIQVELNKIVLTSIYLYQSK